MNLVVYDSQTKLHIESVQNNIMRNMNKTKLHVSGLSSVIQYCLLVLISLKLLRHMIVFIVHNVAVIRVNEKVLCACRGRVTTDGV